MVLLKQVSGEEQLTSVVIHLCSFWVKIYDIPMKFRTERHLPLTAGRLGQFCEIDERGPVGWGKYVRARVVIDVDQPLKKKIHSQSATASTLVFPVRYDNLPNYYYGCGLIGHLVQECDAWADVDSDVDQEFPYGEGLRAFPTKAFYTQITRVSPQKKPIPRRPISVPPPQSSTSIKAIDSDTLSHQVARAVNLDGSATLTPPSYSLHLIRCST
ncbi:hypothetical protein Tsubulata_044305 [Turnera subulata]|uniref:CCHC-type domain-containing protein n=1 Tax=Turnera subulata TaxID=218843 RepID=A0A9Q0FVW9_9ROSI|nr:hypothetical protein Tsubulata_044305 [Turnera subulata]